MEADQLTHIHRLVPAPEPTGDSETLVLLHGTGGDEQDLIPLGQMLAPKAALLGVRGQVLENGMPRYFRRLAEGVFDEDDLVKRTHELADFLAQAAVKYELNPQRLTAVGYSNGANIAASMLLLRPNIFHRAVLFRAMIPLVPDVLPDLQGKRVWLSAGRQDPLIPATNTEQLAAMLEQAGAAVTIEWQNTGHGLVQAELAQAVRWMEGTE